MDRDDTRRTQLAENMRFYADMRFKQLTLLIAFQTAAAAGVVQYSDAPFAGSLDTRSSIGIAALAFTAVMWVMEVRSTTYGFAAGQAAPDLWPQPTGQRWTLLRATTAVLFLHLALYVSWLWCVWHWHGPATLQVVFAALGLLLLFFSVLNYKPILRSR